MGIKEICRGIYDLFSSITFLILLYPVSIVGQYFSRNNKTFYKQTVVMCGFMLKLYLIFIPRDCVLKPAFRKIHIWRKRK